MGPAWAYASGQVLDVDIISQYGIGFVAVLSRLMQFLGGITYEHMMFLILLLVLY